jgi:hypothetical protein
MIYKSALAEKENTTKDEAAPALLNIKSRKKTGEEWKKALLQ